MDDLATLLKPHAALEGRMTGLSRSDVGAGGFELVFLGADGAARLARDAPKPGAGTDGQGEPPFAPAPSSPAPAGLTAVRLVAFPQFSTDTGGDVTVPDMDLWEAAGPSVEVSPEVAIGTARNSSATLAERGDLAANSADMNMMPAVFGPADGAWHPVSGLVEAAPDGDVALPQHLTVGLSSALPQVPGSGAVAAEKSLSGGPAMSGGGPGLAMVRPSPSDGPAQFGSPDQGRAGSIAGRVDVEPPPGPVKSGWALPAGPHSMERSGASRSASGSAPGDALPRGVSSTKASSGPMPLSSDAPLVRVAKSVPGHALQAVGSAAPTASQPVAGYVTRNSGPGAALIPFPTATQADAPVIEGDLPASRVGITADVEAARASLRPGTTDPSGPIFASVVQTRVIPPGLGAAQSKALRQVDHPENMRVETQENKPLLAAGAVSPPQGHKLAFPQVMPTGSETVSIAPVQVTPTFLDAAADPATMADAAQDALGLSPIGEAASTARSAPVPPPPLSGQASFLRQVSLAVETSLRRDGDGPIEVALDPPELGRLRMNLVEINGALTISITADRAETADLMRRHLALLAQEFARAGLDPPTVDLSQGDAGRGGHRSHADGDQATATIALFEAVPGPGQDAPSAIRSTSVLDLRL